MMYKTKRQFRSRSSLLVVLAGLILIFSVFFYLTSSTWHQSKADNNSVISFPGISELLNSDWESRGIRHVQPLEDIKGRPSSLLMRTDEDLFNVNNSLAFIYYSVMTYTDSISAKERYEIQDEVIFFQFDDEQYRWEESQLIEDVVSHADMVHAECMLVVLDSGGQDMRCSSIILYGRYVVAVNMFPLRNDIEYISDELLTDIFASINNIMQEIVADEISAY